MKTLLYAQDTDTGLKRFLENLFKLAAFSDPTKFLANNVVKSALKIVNKDRAYFTLKWANALSKFFRGLSEVIEHFGSTLDDLLQNLNFETRSDWPSNRVFKLIDRAGALHIIDRALLSEFDYSIDNYLDQLLYTSAAYKRYSLKVGSLLEEMVFARREHLFEVS